MFGLMSEGIVLVDDEQRVTYCNRAAALMLGVSAEETMAERRQVADLPCGRPLADTLVRLPAAAPPDQPIVCEERIEPRQDVTLMVHAAPVLAKSGENAGAILLFLDITAQRSQAKQRSELIRLTAHEMKAPIGVVLSYLSIVLDELRDSHPAFTRAHVIERSIVRLEALLQLLKDMRDLDHLDQSGAFQEMGPVDLRGLARECVRSVAESAAEENIGLQANLDQELPQIEADEAGVTRLVGELLDNALRYTNSGGTVSIECRREGPESVSIRVVDTGVGIPEADLERIYDRFYRVRNARTRDVAGTGLGLSIVRKIVEIHSADIAAQSTENEGSTFTVTLPLQQPAGTPSWG